MSGTKWRLLFLLAGVSLICGAFAYAHDSTHSLSLDAVETPQLQQKAAGDESNSVAGVAKLLGRIHPAVVHLPIGFILLLLVLDFLWATGLVKGLEKSGLIAAAATVASFVPAAISGFIRSSEMFGSDEPPLLLAHRNFMIAAGVMIAVGFVIRVVNKNRLEGKYRILYMSIILLAVALVLLGGHEGGKLVHGLDFLTLN